MLFHKPRPRFHLPQKELEQPPELPKYFFNRLRDMRI